MFMGVVCCLGMAAHFMGGETLFLMIKNAALELKNFDTFILGVTAVSAVTLLGIVGMFILDYIVSIISLFRNVILTRTFLNRYTFKSRFFKALLPFDRIVNDYFQNNKDALFHFFYFRSWARPENILNSDIIETVILQKIYGYYIEKFDAGNITYFDFHGSLTQEQVKRENGRKDVYNIYYIIINAILLTTFALYSPVYSPGLKVMFLLALTCFILSLFTEIYDRKEFLASSIVYGFFDNFTVAPLADISDREAV